MTKRMMPLDRNESYWLLDEALEEAVRVCGVCEYSTYPDYGELKDALARYAGVAPEQVLVTAGSDAAIEFIARAYAGPGGRVVLPVPTFYGYETILGRVGAEIVPVPYEERDGRFVFPLAGTLAALADGSAKILFLCHPNNPLGAPLSDGDLRAIVEAARGSETLFVVDEAYFEFHGTTFLPYLAELPNLVIIRTLSKSFALAGTRVGYALAAPSVVERLSRIMPPWSVAHPSVAAALSLLARADAVATRREAVISARDNFVKDLRAIPGITPYPSRTNFVLARVPDAARVRDTLFAAGIKVALGEPMTQFPAAKALLSDTLRIVVPAPEDLPVFRQAFAASLYPVQQA